VLSVLFLGLSIASSWKFSADALGYSFAICGCPKRTSAVRGGGLSSADMEGGASFRCGRPYFYVQKISNFSKIYGVSARTSGGRLSQCGQGGEIFAIFVRYTNTASMYFFDNSDPNSSFNIMSYFIYTDLINSLLDPSLVDPGLNLIHTTLSEGPQKTVLTINKVLRTQIMVKINLR